MCYEIEDEYARIPYHLPLITYHDAPNIPTPLWERLSSLDDHGQPAPLRKARPWKPVPTYHIPHITYHDDVHLSHTTIALTNQLSDRIAVPLGA